MTLCAIGVCILDIRAENAAADKVPRITNAIVSFTETNAADKVPRIENQF